MGEHTTTVDCLLGIDVGTTGAKALLCRADDGAVLAAGFAPYPLHHPQPSWAEQDPADWWQACGTATRACLAEAAASGVAPQSVRGVALSGQMHGAVLLDDAGEVVRPCIIWADQRSGAECDEIHRRVGLERLVELTGNPALTGFTAAKVLWVRNHEPEAFARARRLLLPKDYIRLRMTGEPAIERSDAAGTNLLDIHTGDWAPEVLDALDLPVSLLPLVVGSTDVCGTLAADAARHLGLPSGTPVAGGGADNACGATGAGVVAPGPALLSIGSSGVVLAASPTPQIDRSTPLPRIHTFFHAMPNTWYLMGVTQAAGLSLRWARDTFGGAESGDYDTLTAEAARVPPGAEGLLFLPYLQGERAPHLDPLARGAWIGLTAAHRRGHLVRAVLEGVAFSLKDCFALLSEQGLPLTEIRVTGGGARSPLWRQICADILERPVVTLAADEGPAFGAALMAGTAVGLYPSLPAACARTVQLGGAVTPDSSLAPAYRAHYALYCAAYPALREIMHGLSRTVV
ncbi:MAG TPA: xylulokinase [Ktedonobacterales bacterium]|nr:xylulokinase [Ktedonobacterales bacterium]